MVSPTCGGEARPGVEQKTKARGTTNAPRVSDYCLCQPGPVRVGPLSGGRQYRVPAHGRHRRRPPHAYPFSRSIRRSQTRGAAAPRRPATTAPVRRVHGPRDARHPGRLLLGRLPAIDATSTGRSGASCAMHKDPAKAFRDQLETRLISKRPHHQWVPSVSRQIGATGFARNACGAHNRDAAPVTAGRGAAFYFRFPLTGRAFRRRIICVEWRDGPALHPQGPVSGVGPPGRVEGKGESGKGGLIGSSFSVGGRAVDP